MTAAKDAGNSMDDGVDQEIFSCLDLANPTSFFLYAGAGSGKTRSLVSAVNLLRRQSGRRLSLHSQNIGVITYTNAACDEIKQRLEFDPLVQVATIHSFAWSLIGGFNADIRSWLRVNLTKEIQELELAQQKGRAGTKIAIERERSIASKRRRLVTIESVSRFIYSPSGEYRGRDSLNHSEVINISASFLVSKIVLQNILINRFPVLLIDESQDTNKHLMDALLEVQNRNPIAFCLGLFGDTMQRIYADGKVDLENAVPVAWARPAKRMNHRCPQRVIRLINRIRLNVDKQQQVGRTDKAEGFARLFVLSSSIEDKFKVEAKVAARMAMITGDPLWTDGGSDYKTLILEHHMAARRMGFHQMFESLHEIDRLRTGLLDGSLPGLVLFTSKVLPLVQAMKANNQFAAAAIVRSKSPLLDKAAFKAASVDQKELLLNAKIAVGKLMDEWANHGQPTFLDIIRNVNASGLFEIPDSLKALISDEPATDPPPEPEGEDDRELRSWEASMKTPFEQIIGYDRYIRDDSPFGTHQGVKGREFPRVMVIVDDAQARGFMFSYEKLFGAKEKSSTDLKNEAEGSETTLDRTRRLFYVTCSRAEESLAVVAYSSEPSKVQARAIAEDWFRSEEIEVII